jgi:Leucine-rich repeat (LRR) protein
MISLDILSFVFEFVGFYDELISIRSVCKFFKQCVKKKCITGIKLLHENPEHMFVLFSCATTLRYIKCSNLGIHSLPQFLNCRYLDCSHNYLKEIPYMEYCIYLNCRDNDIMHMPTSLPVCEILLLRFNQIKELPDLPNNIVLDCYDNPINKKIIKLYKNRFIDSNCDLKFLKDLPLDGFAVWNGVSTGRQMLEDSPDFEIEDVFFDRNILEFLGC